MNVFFLYTNIEKSYIINLNTLEKYINDNKSYILDKIKEIFICLNNVNQKKKYNNLIQIFTNNPNNIEYYERFYKCIKVFYSIMMIFIL